MRNDSNQIGRRNVLKMLGSTAAAGVSVAATSGTAVATETRNRLVRAYSDERRLRAAFQQHGEGLRRTLVDEGVVPEDFDFGTLTFDLDSDVSSLEPAARDGLAGVTAVEREGVYSALGIASASSATHDIALFVQPEREKAYALVEPKAGDEQLLATDSGAQLTGDCFYTTCTNECCADATAIEDQWSCRIDGSGNCTDCEVTGTSCNCPDCSCPADSPTPC